MAVNEGNVDRALRALLGVTLIVLGTWTVVSPVVAAALVIVGLLSLSTGVIGWCPVYSLTHFDSFSTRR